MTSSNIVGFNREENTPDQTYRQEDGFFERMKKFDFLRTPPKVHHWVKDSFVRSTLTAAPSIIFERSINTFAINSLLAVGGGMLGCSVLFLGRKEFKKSMMDFYNLPRASKVLAVSLSIILGVTVPLLAEHLFTIQVIVNSSYLIITPLTILAGITPLLKAKSEDIDFYFWRTSNHGTKIFIDRETWKPLAETAFTELQKNIQETAEPYVRGIAEEVGFSD